MKYQIKIADSVPAEYRSIAPIWLEEVLDWLLDQPRAMSVSGWHPMFEERDFTIGGRVSFGKGLRSRSTGKGWMNCPLMLNGFLILETRPKYTLINEPSAELCSKVSWVYLANNSFEQESYFDEDFKQEDHYQMQLRYIERHSPDLYERATRKIRADGVKRRNAERQNNKPVSQAKSSPPSKPIEDRRSRTCNYPPVMNPIPTPSPAPTPELSEYQQRVIAENKAMWDFIKSRSSGCDSACGSAEDFDK